MVSINTESAPAIVVGLCTAKALRRQYIVTCEGYRQWCSTDDVEARTWTVPERNVASERAPPAKLRSTMPKQRLLLER